MATLKEILKLDSMSQVSDPKKSISSSLLFIRAEYDSLPARLPIA